MYTELIFGAELKKDTPPEVVGTLRYLIGDSESKDNLVFETKSGRRFCGNSYYFGVSRPVNKMWYDEISEAYIVSIRCSLKNYDNEITDFLEWIEPYIDSGSGQDDMYAIVMYEEWCEPKIFYLHKPEVSIESLNDIWKKISEQILTCLITPLWYNCCKEDFFVCNGKHTVSDKVYSKYVSRYSQKKLSKMFGVGETSVGRIKEKQWIIFIIHYFFTHYHLLTGFLITGIGPK